MFTMPKLIMPFQIGLIDFSSSMLCLRYTLLAAAEQLQQSFGNDYAICTDRWLSVQKSNSSRAECWNLKT